LTREFLDYIEDVIDAMNKAERFVDGMEFDSFDSGGKKVSLRLKNSYLWDDMV
jgi:hypothetical protein